MSKLWYLKPAVHWEEALPLGNGRLGAMVFGDTVHERLALNEDTLWSGYPIDRNNPDAARLYPEAQALALTGKLHKAQAFIEDHLLGGFTQSYLPLGDLTIDFDDAFPAQDYRRQLDLGDAVHLTQFTRGGASAMKWSASSPIPPRRCS